MHRSKRDSQDFVDKLILSIILVFSVSCVSLYGQTTSRTFHVQGIVRSYPDSPIAHAEINFVGENFNKTVYSDAGGIYEADLPLGTYSMTAVSFGRSELRYRRPPFKVSSPLSVTLDVVLDIVVSCDLVTPIGGPSPTEKDYHNACGGTDLFPISADTQFPFQLSIQYGSRTPLDGPSQYNSRTTLHNPGIPVFVAYNLFTLQADKVVYDPQTRILKATGSVITDLASGKKESADSMTFRLENGEAIRVP